MKNKRTICIISDSFVPYPISATGMIYNLCKQFHCEGFDVISIHGTSKPKKIQQNYSFKNIDIISSSFLSKLRNKNHFLRLVFEIALSIVLGLKAIFHYKKIRQLDLIVWYGPSSFLWITVLIVKIISKANVYYILRDIFPDWLVAVNLVNNKYIIQLLNFLSFPQYIIPNRIGVETKFNQVYLTKKLQSHNLKRKIEVLYNWPSLTSTNNNNLNTTALSKFSKHIMEKKERDRSCSIGIYIGNRSVAHDYYSGINILKQKNLPIDLNIFGETEKINNNNAYKCSFNEVLWDYISEVELPNALNLVDFGLVTLNRDLLTQNIPGKFVTYTQCSLPILCFANKKSSLYKLIRKYDCGLSVDIADNVNENKKLVELFLKKLQFDKKYFQLNSKKVFKENFNTNSVTKKILKINHSI